MLRAPGREQRDALLVAPILPPPAPMTRSLGKRLRRVPSRHASLSPPVRRTISILKPLRAVQRSRVGRDEIEPLKGYPLHLWPGSRAARQPGYADRGYSGG